MDCVQFEILEKVFKFLASILGDNEEAKFAKLFQKQQDNVAEIPTIFETSVAEDSRRAESVPTGKAKEFQEIGELMVLELG